MPPTVKPCVSTDSAAGRWLRLSCHPYWRLQWQAQRQRHPIDLLRSWDRWHSAPWRSLAPDTVAAPSLAAVRHARRHHASSSSLNSPLPSPGESGEAVEEEDWSSIEVEVLAPAAMASDAVTPDNVRTASSFGAFAAEDVISRSATAAAASDAAGGFAATSSAAVAYETISTIDAYAKAKVTNFIRRQQQQQQQPAGSSAAPLSTRGSSTSAAFTSSASLPGMEVREVQGTADGGDSSAGTQYHARWRLPLPPEYGSRYGEGFAPTAKEAEGVAAMHAERVIDALGFPLFLLSSKQRKHAEAARAAGRWAPMPPAAESGSSSTPLENLTAAELVPPPDTPSPPPLQLVHMTARQQREKELHIEDMMFTPVEKSGFSPLSCTLASPFHFDALSLRRVESFFKTHRSSFHRNLRMIRLEGGAAGGSGTSAASEQMQQQQGGELYLAQLTIPLPPRFGLRIAMGRAPTRRDAVTLACMHAELIIDATGSALYPSNRELQATHAEECAKVKRWCAPPGDCDYRYSVTSPAPLELVERLSYDPTANTAPRHGSSATAAFADPGIGSPPISMTGHNGGEGEGSGAPAAARAHIQVGTSSSDSVESILLQHHQAVSATHVFTNETSMRDYENALLLLERYLEQFVPPSPSAPRSPLLSLMFTEKLGQRDRLIHRATITVPLVEQQQLPLEPAAPASPRRALAYSQSFVAIGISDTGPIAELAAALHALRTLAALNRLTLSHGNPAVSQALESFAVRGHLPVYKPEQPMRSPADLAGEEFPPAVRVMDGVVGRITSAGLVAAQKNARAQVFTPGTVFQSSHERRMIREQSPRQAFPVQHLNREEFLLQELREARARLPQLEWDTTPDAVNRVIVAPDADPHNTRHYNHTLPSVRQPDKEATLRLRDYVERHGKTLDMVSTTTYVRASRDALEEENMFVTTVTLPLPDFYRRRMRDDAGATTAEDAAAAPTALVARGEGSTRADSRTLCAAHAELLLDAHGLPFYDHSTLQRQHADAARALGRWVPVVRAGLMAPAALRQAPPPLRKVTQTSALWARVQRERELASATAAVAESGNSDAAVSPLEKAPRSTSSTLPLSASSVRRSAVGDGAASDDELCDVSKLVFVHSTAIFNHAPRYARMFFAKNGSDFLRAVRQYKVFDAKHGMVHRAIVELPTSPVFGKRYAVGVSDTKRQALRLCAQHVLHVLDALHIKLFNSPLLQVNYARLGAIKGRTAPTPSDGRAAADTPTPPGFHSLPLSEAAKDRPMRIPVPPSDAAAEAVERELVWKTYVKDCETFRQWAQEHADRAAATLLPAPRAPRSGVAAEDATLDIAEAQPHDSTAQRQLLDVCRSVNLLRPIPESVHYEPINLSGTQRVFLTRCALLGTPFTMRGISTTGGAESRQRAFMHGIQLAQRVVRANNERCVRPRPGWADGEGRCFRGLNSTTHNSRVSTLRLWCAMHYPPRVLRVQVKRTDATQKGEESAGGRVLDAATPTDDNNACTQEGDIDAVSSQACSVHFHASAAVVECSGHSEGYSSASKVVASGSCDASGPAAAANAVRGALHKLFESVQRSPTMHTLQRFLFRQPQLHIPSLRILIDAEDVVHQVLARCHAASLPPTRERPGGVLAALLLTDGWWEAVPVYRTWSVDVLHSWLRAHYTHPLAASGARDVAAEAPAGRHDPLRLPCTAATEFSAYSLATPPARAMTAVPVGDGRVWMGPTRLSGALAIMCRCLPPLPSCIEDRDGLAVERDRALPLQLAHVLLMGLLLERGPSAALLVAMVACSEDTFRWYSALIQRSLSVVADSSTAGVASTVSVDVVEAVLLSMDPAAPPLPTSVLQYAAEVQRRLRSTWKDAAAHFGDSSEELTWLRLTETWPAAHEAPSRLSVEETQQLRSHLQCAVVASAAPHEVWVRAAAVEELERERQSIRDVDESDETQDGAAALRGQEDVASSDELFVFQSCRLPTPGYMALRINGMDLTRTDASTATSLSSMAACFASFGVYAAPPSASAAAPAPDGTRHNGSAGTSDEAAGDPDGEDNDDDAATAVADGCNTVYYTRVLGTCVSPLAAVVAGSDGARAKAIDRTSDAEATHALQVADEELPMLMTAFNGVIPVVVRRHSSVPALQHIAVQLRSRIVQVQPFSPAERYAIHRLFTLPVRMAKRDVEDALVEP